MNNEVKMISTDKANMFGVNIDVLEWAEILIDPNTLTKLRNECKDFAKSNKSDKIAIIKVVKVHPRDYEVTIAEIGADETGYTAALRAVISVHLNSKNELRFITPTHDKHNSFEVYKLEVLRTIKNYFESDAYLTDIETSL